MPDADRQSARSARPSFLLVGQILRPHGVRGELRVRILTDYPERIAQLEQVYIGHSPEMSNPPRYGVEHMRMHQDYGLLKLQGIDDRNDAELMRDLFVMVSLEDAVPLEDDELYLFELIGLEVRTEAGDVLGEITEVLETGANDVYVVKPPNGGEILIPVLPETILETNPDEGYVIVRLPEGLIPNR